ncbi:mitogen-activated protein kinase kinase kinase a [Phtheirospermum japonicum]|uniref:Mitogen-activated protein kinase kinase kinase a n=1 Tax=Phtheirospermum japonicum TaxID=374723 RepID=A0A830DA08_9LAMI|nr:mitogen-activated protein kinase kinase kinase a [Phtheirospermum japonicum]
MVQKSLSQPTEWLKGSVIGSGSFGTVHLAIDSSTGALFVAKSAKSEPGIKSLKNEADILEKLDFSPHVIKCMGKDVAFAKNGETRFSLFFEYMAGGSLSDVAQKFGGKLNEKLIRLYTREILRGLKHLHDNGIVHSDVKCKNVLLGASGAVKLADFGCAKRLSGCKNGSMGGTPLWMAPEVLRNEGLGFAADIWSLGCTVIEMATGRPPWGGDVADNPMGVMLMIAKGNGVPDFPRDFSDEGLDFLSRCLDRDPVNRWTSEKLLDHPFVATGKMAVSPTSVLDVASYESDGDDDDDDDGDLLCDDEVDFVGKFPFMEKWCFKEKKVFLEGTDDWITVRSR